MQTPGAPSHKPRRTLPLYAAFDCTGCGQCCKDWRITVDKAAFKRAQHHLQHSPHPGRISAQNAFTLLEDRNERSWATIKHTDDGSCVFLDEDNLCYWHRHFGAQTKGWLCRAYPNISHHSPTSQTIGAALSCKPLVELMRTRFAKPMTLVDAPTDFAKQAAEHPEWVMNPGAKMWLLGDKLVDGEAYDQIEAALLDFVAIEGVPLGLRLLMGRLFLEKLLQRTKHQNPLKAKTVERLFANIERDATALLVQAAELSAAHPTLIARSVRGFFARMAQVGIPRARAARFNAIIDHLHLNAPMELIAARLWSLHQQRFVPQMPQLEGMLGAYASHRIVRAQAVSLGGLIPGMTEVMLALTLVWATALAQAEEANSPVTPEILGDAIATAEKIFFHAAAFEAFFDVNADFSAIHGVAYAGVLAEIFNGR